MTSKDSLIYLAKVWAGAFAMLLLGVALNWSDHCVHSSVGMLCLPSAGAGQRLLLAEEIAVSVTIAAAGAALAVVFLLLMRWLLIQVALVVARRS